MPTPRESYMYSELTYVLPILNDLAGLLDTTIQMATLHLPKNPLLPDPVLNWKVHGVLIFV
jgi:hypothetical protein